MSSDTHVFWPGGEQEHFVLDPSRLDPKALTNANNILMVLSINRSIVRGSVATGRAQTLTWLLPSPPESTANMQVVSIASEPVGTLVVLAATKGQVDPAQLKAASTILCDGAMVAPHEIESVLGKAGAPAVTVVAHGPKTDAGIDEAYGLALYLGAALNG